MNKSTGSKLLLFIALLFIALRDPRILFSLDNVRASMYHINMRLREKVTRLSHPQYRVRLAELDREGWTDFHKLTLRESLMFSVAATCLDAMEEATNSKGDST